MIDFRYHAVSILGVFVALAVGIVLGSIVGGDGAVQRQQIKLIESIQKDINTLREQANRQSKELEMLKEASNQLIDWAIDERLKGRVVAFFQVKESNIKLTEEAAALVKDAGGESRIVTVDIDRIKEQVGSNPEDVVNIFKKIADGVFKSEVTTEIAGFKRDGFYAEEGTASQAQHLVIVYDEGSQEFLIELAKYLGSSMKSPTFLVNQLKVVREKGTEIVSEGASIVYFGNDPLSKAAFILSFDASHGIYGTNLSGGKLLPERKE